MVALRDEILGLAASIHAGEAELVAKLAMFDAGEGWVGSGVKSLGHWLTLTCGFTTSEARVRADMAVRRGSQELPELFGAFDSGAFSLGALRCAEKVATPANDAEVTRVALAATAPQASRTYAAFRKAVGAERRHEEHLANRDRTEDPDTCDDTGGSEDEPLSPGADDLDSSNPGDPDTWMRMWWDEYQFLCIDGRLDSTDGAAFKALLDAIRHDAEANGGDTTGTADAPDDSGTPDDTGRAEVGGGSQPAGAGPPGSPADPDALPADIAETHGEAVSHDENRVVDPPDPHGLPECSKKQLRLSWIDAFSRLTRLAGDALVSGGVRGRWQDRFAVSVTIDAEVLLGLRDGCGTLDDGAPVDPATVCDWLPAATLEGLICHRGAPLYMGRKVRVANRKTRRALRIRDGGCAFPGCDCTEFLDAHHIYIWDNGALTNIDELVLLCRRHHRLFHRGEYTITMCDGSPRFHSDVLGTGLPPPTSLIDRYGRAGTPQVSATATKRSCEPLTHYAKDVFVALLFGTPDNHAQVIRSLS